MGETVERAEGNTGTLRRWFESPPAVRPKTGVFQELETLQEHMKDMKRDFETCDSGAPHGFAFGEPILCWNRCGRVCKPSTSGQPGHLARPVGTAPDRGTKITRDGDLAKIRQDMGVLMADLALRQRKKVVFLPGCTGSVLVTVMIWGFLVIPILINCFMVMYGY
ncbi:hypothetical protein BJ170DRAFT_623877 [Xylariales sp. AK1849]|nr:hypothetical protein BJ170DRAFT_623877 [Xylariales sp. AK1849]